MCYATASCYATCHVLCYVPCVIPVLFNLKKSGRNFLFRRNFIRTNQPQLGNAAICLFRLRNNNGLRYINNVPNKATAIQQIRLLLSK